MNEKYRVVPFVENVLDCDWDEANSDDFATDYSFETYSEAFAFCYGYELGVAGYAGVMPDTFILPNDDEGVKDFVSDLTDKDYPCRKCKNFDCTANKNKQGG